MEKEIKEVKTQRNLVDLLYDPDFNFANFACKKVMYNALMLADEAVMNGDSEELEILSNIIYNGAMHINQMDIIEMSFEDYE